MQAQRPQAQIYQHPQVDMQSLERQITQPSEQESRAADVRSDDFKVKRAAIRAAFSNAMTFAVRETHQRAILTPMEQQVLDLIHDSIDAYILNPATRESNPSTPEVIATTKDSGNGFRHIKIAESHGQETEEYQSQSRDQHDSASGSGQVQASTSAEDPSSSSSSISVP